MNARGCVVTLAVAAPVVHSARLCTERGESGRGQAPVSKRLGIGGSRHPDVPMPPRCPQCHQKVPTSPRHPHAAAWERQREQSSLQSPPKPPSAFHTALTRSRSPLINKHPRYRARGPGAGWGGFKASTLGDPTASSASADDPALTAFPTAPLRARVLLPGDFGGEIRARVIHPRLQTASKAGKITPISHFAIQTRVQPSRLPTTCSYILVSAFKAERGAGTALSPR